MKTLIHALIALVGLTAAAAAQEPGAVPLALREQFEAGQYQPVIEAAAPDAEPPVQYLAALGHQRLKQLDELQVLASRLSSRPADDPWHFIGLSIGQLARNEDDAARVSAQDAVTRAPKLAQSHFQLGLVHAKRQAWKEAGIAFDRAGELDPQDAYAFYYGGLSHYRAGRRDLMAVRFERFLKLAPDAPERPEVLQIMRTIRGR